LQARLPLSQPRKSQQINARVECSRNKPERCEGEKECGCLRVKRLDGEALVEDAAHPDLRHLDRPDDAGLPPDLETKPNEIAGAFVGSRQRSPKVVTEGQGLPRRKRSIGHAQNGQRSRLTVGCLKLYPLSDG